ncbi:MAG TPA: hypothetical protein VGL56_18730 [Fimbriimonadaceae bacterium]|jgi:hypothetical protein
MMKRLILQASVFALSALFLICGCSDKPKVVLPSIAGAWRAAGPAYGIMDFEKSGDLRAGQKGSVVNMGTWTMDDDIVTFNTGGQTKRAKVEWTGKESLKITPIDAKGGGRPMELTRADSSVLN